MVSLEQTLEYSARIVESPKLHSFDSLLLGRQLTFNSDGMNEADQIYFGLLNAIQTNNKAEFEKYYSRKSKSNPTKDSPSPFVNDDFLIFTIIVGVNKFSCDKNWIQNIVSIRNRSLVTITFENILAEDYYSKSGLPEIVYMYLSLYDHALITEEFINFTFKKISENTSLFENRSDFQIICSLRAYNSIILKKDALGEPRVALLNQFESNFLKRVKAASWIVQAFLFFGLVYLILNLPTYSSKAISIIEKYNYFFTIIGALGLTFLGNLIPVTRTVSQKLIMIAMGYPKDLANKKIRE